MNDVVQMRFKDPLQLALVDGQHYFVAFYQAGISREGQ